MTNADRKDFAEMILGLGMAYNAPITEPLTDLYFKAMSDLEIEQVRKAALHIIKTSKFFPKVADFYDFIEGNALDQAQAAWNALVAAVGTVGGWTSLSVPDPALAYAIRHTFGGWIEATEQLPNPSDPMYANLQKQFVGNYRHARRTGSGDADYFPGRCEASNRQLASTFERGVPLMDEGGEHCLVQKVGAIIAGQVVFLNLNFNVMSGMLTAESRRFLRDGPKLLNA